MQYVASGQEDDAALQESPAPESGDIPGVLFKLG